ncbi:hypothetical protein ANN_22529 [Periplaneta americana]|uniref:Reverse transcriptase domain-containing protein n=1 Tax=Periplaneta americana TaxID=6978 RepID=A0ABQ8S8G5_PERAM|nr:hypothetical protein ANN_22529 [Periplaneta americana]
MNYLDKHNILSDNQFGFRKTFSTDNAIYQVTKNIVREFDQGNKCIGIFLDIRKAFDTVKHDTLIEKLDLLGIKEDAFASVARSTHRPARCRFRYLRTSCSSSSCQQRLVTAIENGREDYIECCCNDAYSNCAKTTKAAIQELDGMTHNQIDHIFVDKRRHTSIVDIRTFRGADCNSDHYLVIGELRERLSVAKRVEQQANISRFNILKLKDEETKQRYQVEISNRFAALATPDEAEEELDVNSVWNNIRDNIKIAVEQSIGYHETKKKKPWFDEDCSIVVARRKRAKLKFLQGPIVENRDNYFNERREASRTLRNKREIT